MVIYGFFFFFKQQTAYELRIGGWSSDVCSSDLLCAVGLLLVTGILGTDDVLSVFSNSAPITIAAMFVLSAALERTGVIDTLGRQVARVSGRSPLLSVALMMIGATFLYRKRVGLGKSGSGRVALGGGRHIK